MYAGYLNWGGNEVINSERARTYAETANAPMFWLRGSRTPALPLVVTPDDPSYDATNLPMAPWYDQSAPEVSTRFYGCYGIDILGAEDSTRDTPVVEGLSDGGLIGRSREGVKSVRVKTVLLGQGADALEHGMGWLKSALSPNACGQHGRACGVTDALFFSSELGNPNLVPVEIASTLLRTNVIKNPAGATATLYSQAGASPAANTVSVSTGRPGGLRSTNLKRTITGSGQTGMQFAADPTLLTPGMTYVVSCWMRSSRGGTINLYAEGTGAAGYWGATNHTPPSVTLVANTWTFVSYTCDIPATVTGILTASFGAYGLTAQAGDTFEMAEVLVESGIIQDYYFDGATANTDDLAMVWLGTPNASASTLSQRNYEMQNDLAEYQTRMETLTRFLHGVAVTSGPFIADIYESRGFNAWVVEWTITAERPWVYGLTRTVNLPALPSTVIADLPHNLVRHPSAELAGSLVEITRNLSTNPSVEVDTTGWNSTSSVVSGANPSSLGLITSGRVTELSAAGTASFRTRLLGTTTANTGRALLNHYQDVTVSGLATGSRLSFNVWGALVVTGTGSTINSLSAKVEWYNGATLLSTTNLGTATSAEYVGKAFSLALQTPPVTATIARVIVTTDVSWTSSATGTVNSDIRFYADALAVTAP